MSNRAARIARPIAVGAVLLLCAAAIAAPLLAPADPLRQDLDRRFARPGSPGYPLGSDNLGRDLLSRVIWGARATLLTGLLAVAVALAVGTPIGLLAASRAGRPVAEIPMLCMDVLFAFPALLLAITATAMFGGGLLTTALSTGIIFVPVFARLTRAEMLSLLTEEFLLAARALGCSPLRILLRHILPNLTPILITQTALAFALSIAIAATLSFLGLGVQPPTPDWGLMLKDGRDFLFQAPWMALYPGLALLLTTFAFNALGDLGQLRPRGD